jgi:hypothetical protein
MISMGKLNTIMKFGIRSKAADTRRYLVPKVLEEFMKTKGSQNFGGRVVQSDHDVQA